MSLGMAVGTEQTALGRFHSQDCITSVGHGAQIQFEGLFGRVNVMPRQGRIVLTVPATLATPATLGDQGQLAAQATDLLAQIILVTIVCVVVLALAAAILALTPFERPPANGAPGLWHI